MDKGEILIYQSPDGNIKVDVRFDDETVWLIQSQMGQLFGKDKRTISEHISNIFKEGELNENSVVRNFRTTAADGKAYEVAYYNLEAILAVGFRVKSLRGTQFRRWANTQLRELIVKGFVMNDERLKNPGGWNYFDELLARIRDIRSSEKLFYQKVLGIYAEADDYDAKHEATQKLFRVLQNKMHFAAHGHTAAEVVIARANATLPNMGLTSWAGARPRKHDVSIAKNCAV